MYAAILLFAGLVSPSSADPAVATAAPRTLLLIKPSKEYPRNSEGDLVKLSDGRLCLVYSRFSGGTDDAASAQIVARTSSDGGKTWSNDRILVEREGRQNVMSVSILRLRDGTLLLFYLRKNGCDDLQLMVRRSQDEFATLSEPVRATVADGYNVVNNARVIQLASGRLVVPAAMHPCPDGDEKNFMARAVLRAFLSDDDGRTWRTDATEVRTPAPDSPVFQEPGVIELKDGRVMMYIRCDRGSQYQCFSTDGGEHWSRPEPGPLGSPLSPATIARVPQTGDLVAIWNDHSGWHVFPKGKRTPLCIAISKDEGLTWSPSRVIEGDPAGHYCYTAARFIGDELVLAYCAEKGLTALKVMAISAEWLYPDTAKAKVRSEK